MLCQGVERLPEGREWRYELKLDGFRAIGRKAGRTAQLWSRNQKNFARRFPMVGSESARRPTRMTPLLTVRSSSLIRTADLHSTCFRDSAAANR